MAAAMMMALYGFVWAIAAAFINLLVVDTLEQQAQRRADLQTFFKKVEFAITQDMLARNLALPSGNVSTELLTSNILAAGTPDQMFNAVRASVQAPWGNISNDPWGNSLLVYSSNLGNGSTYHVSPYDTRLQRRAVAIVSRGPDRVLDPTLQATLNTFLPPMMVGPTPADNFSALLAVRPTAGTDDIIYTFTTIAPNDRWGRKIEETVNMIRSAATERYLQQARSFYRSNPPPSTQTTAAQLLTWTRAQANGPDLFDDNTGNPLPLDVDTPTQLTPDGVLTFARLLGVSANVVDLQSAGITINIDKPLNRPDQIRVSVDTPLDLGGMMVLNQGVIINAACKPPAGAWDC